MTDKQIYRELCKREESIPLFSQDWWMDATCGEEGWEVILVRDNQGNIIASMPYLLKRKWGIKFICQPQLTQTNGIWFRPRQYKNEQERLSTEKRIDEEVIKQIEALKLHFFVQCFHHSFTNWLPFYWKGFQQTTRYTYRIENIQESDIVFSNFSNAKIRHIKKATKRNLHLSSMTAEAFYDFCSRTHEAKGEKNLLPKSIVLRCIEEATQRGMGKVLAVKDEQEVIHSALFLCWDKETAYYLIPATHPRYKTSGASSLIVWEAIQEAKKHVNSFDFEGSMEESIENSYRQYGAHQTPYFKIKKGLLSYFF